MPVAKPSIVYRPREDATPEAELDIALLKDLGVGSRPRKLKRPEEMLTVDG